MHILIAGGSGFLGRALTRTLAAEGHQITTLSRRPNADGGAGSPRVVTWSPDGSAGPWAEMCAGVDVVVNLAGESIAAGRWSESRKRVLADSRVNATRSLAAFVGHAAKKPSLFISSSAIGYYGDRGAAALDETAAAGQDFLANLAVAWEREAQAAAGPTTRVVLVRTGIVLDPAEGALGRMLLPFKLGLGGPFGLGRQFMSWIHREDWVRMIAWCISARDLSGPVNAVSPAPVTNVTFARTLGRVLRRPAFAVVPPFVLRLVLGEMAGPLLLSSQRVVPAVAARGGFVFGFPELELALRDLLALSRPPPS